MAILPKPSADSVSIKTPKAFFAEIEETVIKFVWNHKRVQIVKEILKKQETQTKAGRIRLPDFKLHYKAIVIKTVCYYHKTKYIKWNKEPRIKPWHTWSTNT